MPSFNTSKQFVGCCRMNIFAGHCVTHIVDTVCNYGMGVLAMIDKESETIEYLVSILLTFTSDQMAAFVAGAQEIIAQYTPKN